MLAIAGSALMATTACNKAETIITKTENVTVALNEVYTYTLPATDDKWIISNEADHASLTKLGTDAAGNGIYQYTPAANYIGADQVVVATTHDGTTANSSTTKQPGKCGTTTDTEDDYEITLNITTIPN